MKLPTPAEADKIIAEEYDIGVVIPMTDRVRLTVELAATTMALRRNIETLDRKLSEAETRLEMLDGAANDAVWILEGKLVNARLLQVTCGTFGFVAGFMFARLL